MSQMEILETEHDEDGNKTIPLWNTTLSDYQAQQVYTKIIYKPVSDRLAQEVLALGIAYMNFSVGRFTQTNAQFQKAIKTLKESDGIVPYIPKYYRAVSYYRQACGTHNTTNRESLLENAKKEGVNILQDMKNNDIEHEEFETKVNHIIGLALKDLKLERVALKYLQTALELSPDNLIIFFDLIETMLNIQDKRQTALDLLIQKTFESNTENRHLLHYWCGIAHEWNYDYVNAERHYQASINCNANFTDGYRKLGSLYKKMATSKRQEIRKIESGEDDTQSSLFEEDNRNKIETLEKEIQQLENKHRAFYQKANHHSEYDDYQHALSQRTSITNIDILPDYTQEI